MEKYIRTLIKQDLKLNDIAYVNSIIDRQTLKIKEHIDTINSLKGDVKERDLSIMELVDGESNRYRAIRSGIWNDEEILMNSDRLDIETLKAKRDYDVFVRNSK